MRTSAGLLLAACLAGGAACLLSGDVWGATVNLSPGDDIQAAVDSHQAGTVFMLAAGMYRLQSVTPKDSDNFIGADGAILNGSKLLADFDSEGGLFVARNQPIDPDTQVHGECLKKYPRCDHPQDLYFDGKALRAVNKLSKVRPGTFYYDYAHEAVYFADDPSGHAVELSYRPFAIGGSADDVTVQNLIVENYACADQQGAIGDHGAGKQWEIYDNEVRWNHGVGIAAPRDVTIMRNNVHHNGELGVGAGAGSGAFEDNEIAFNAWNGTNCDWECGGVKWAEVTEWIVERNYVHDNEGNGLWADINSKQMLFEDNRIVNNRRAGISIEISHATIIDRNFFKGNGARTFGWGWHGQIQIQNSVGVAVENNTLVLDRRRGGNGIIIIQQDRGRPNMPSHNEIFGNDITMAGGGGVMAGWFADYKPNKFAADNVFHDNHYHVYAPDGPFWSANEYVSFADWQATGQDAGSTVDATEP
ncbi:MAG TPA: right-handed parallel beta-helix repeat-containing protein [Rhizomicrobium sp.]|nr:right-handed parallel beta-helix repeat-containing protein [Rhizomicrobium sp.]